MTLIRICRALRSTLNVVSSLVEMKTEVILDKCWLCLLRLTCVLIPPRCFQQLFQRVSVIEKKLVIESECLLTADLDLSGLQILWNIALLSKEEGIATLAIDSLRTLFLHLSAGLQVRDNLLR